MADLKACDIHDTENNIVDVNKTQVYKIYVQKEEIGADKKKKTTALFVGQSEGIDACHKCTMTALIGRLTGSGTRFSWNKVEWEQEQIMEKDGKTPKLGTDGKPMYRPKQKITPLDEASMSASIPAQ